MGIENRDYIRESRPAGPFSPASSPWAIKFLLIANIAVFLLQNVSPRITDWLALQPKFEVGPSSVKVRAAEHLGGGRYNIDNEPTYSLPASTPVDWKGDLGGFWLVEVDGREFAVRPDDVRYDLSRSWPMLWQIVTYGFCHSTRGIMHILVNMFVLWMFGRLIESIYGSREFLAFYLSGVVAAGLCHLAVFAVAANPAQVVGASGGVMAVVFLTAMNFPKLTVYVMFVLPMPLWVVAVIYAAINALGMLNPSSNVAHAAHLGGAAFGVAYKYFGWRVTGWLETLSGGWQAVRQRARISGLKRSRPRVRLYQPETDADFERRVDEVLAKLHRDGEASLTDGEREILSEASRRYRNRR